MNILSNVASKILNEKSLSSMLKVWKFKDKRIVFTNGCFDILHYGHLYYLAEAKNQGDILLIGLNTDDSVKRLKGNDRPVNDEYSRSMQLAAIQFVDAIILFGEDTPQLLIEKVMPDVLVKGGDYKKAEIVGADFVEKNGGRIKIIPFKEGFSTSKIINEMMKN